MLYLLFIPNFSVYEGWVVSVLVLEFALELLAIRWGLISNLACLVLFFTSPLQAFSYLSNAWKRTSWWSKVKALPLRPGLSYSSSWTKIFPIPMKWFPARVGEPISFKLSIWVVGLYLDAGDSSETCADNIAQGGIFASVLLLWNLSGEYLFPKRLIEGAKSLISAEEIDDSGRDLSLRSIKEFLPELDSS